MGENEEIQAQRRQRGKNLALLVVLLAVVVLIYIIALVRMGGI